ncbi:MAG TPA: ASCH domain-containing protein [Ilumatobacteraceae bacterium]
MLFSADSWPGIADGSITVTFRAWQRSQAKVGGRYRIAGMLIEVIDVRQVALDEITADDATKAGAADLAALLRRLGSADPVWRIDFTYVGPDDRIAKRNDTSAEDLSAVISRLTRLDRNGPWTRTTLQLIDRYPGIVSTTLAQHAEQERAAFKLNVRKLKELGLTESLDVGYRLSPRGEAVLRALG